MPTGRSRPASSAMTEPRRRGRPRSTGTRECARCHSLVATIRTTWPEGPICGPCFTAAARTYGLCAFCGAHRLLPGRSATGHNICRDCAAITTNLDCVNCGREAERRRGGHCARCVLTADLDADPQTPCTAGHAHQTAHHRAGSGPAPGKHHHLDAPPRHRRAVVQDRYPRTALSHDAFDALPPQAAWNTCAKCWSITT